MKIVFITLLLCFLMPGTALGAPDEQAILMAFQNIVAKHIDGYLSDPRLSVRYVSAEPIINSAAYWMKSKISVSDSSYDVQKTTSLVSPYLGILNYNVVLNNTKKQPTKELAEKDTDFESPGIPGKARIAFAFQSDKWVVKKYEYYSDSFGWLEVTAEKMAFWYESLKIKNI